MYDARTTYRSPLGLLTLAGSGDAVTGLWLEGQKYFGRTLPKTEISGEALPVLELAKDWLDRYFSGKKPAVSELPLAPAGTEFQRAVWQILCEIPYGEVTTYGGIAQKMAVRMGRERMSAQAVGGAVGHNPISIIIPCHRVVGSNGSLTGYAGGIEKKIQLLEWEGVELSGFFTPKKVTAL